MKITALLFFLLLHSSCRKDENNSNLSASSVQEVAGTSKYYSDIWHTDIETTFDKLPTTGSSDMVPYSGFWYPEQYGGTNYTRDPQGDSTHPQASPLVKYDAAFYGDKNRKASSWEHTNHTITKEQIAANPSLEESTSWYGHCNGFSSTAARHKAPTKNIVRNNITFTPADIRALLAEIYMSNNYRFLGGARCESANTAAHPDQRVEKDKMSECEDVNPATLHIALTNWIGIKKKNLVVDMSRNNAVWNYPTYGYQYTATEISEADALSAIETTNTTYVFNKDFKKLVMVTAVVNYSDARNDGEHNTADNVPKTHTYKYILELDGTGKIIGGEWTAASRNEHPDFIWLPLEPMQGTGHRGAANPYLNVDIVLDMWAESAGFESYAKAPKTLTAPLWTDVWGMYNNFELTIDGHNRGTAFLTTSNNILNIKPLNGTTISTIELNGKPLTANNGNYEFKAPEGVNWFVITYNTAGASNKSTVVFHVIKT